MSRKDPADKVIRDIRRKTGKCYSAEKKIHEISHIREAEKALSS